LPGLAAPADESVSTDACAFGTGSVVVVVADVVVVGSSVTGTIQSGILPFHEQPNGIITGPLK